MKNELSIQPATDPIADWREAIVECRKNIQQLENAIIYWQAKIKAELDSRKNQPMPKISAQPAILEVAPKLNGHPFPVGDLVGATLAQYPSLKEPAVRRGIYDLLAKGKNLERVSYGMVRNKIALIAAILLPACSSFAATPSLMIPIALPETNGITTNVLTFGFTVCPQATGELIAVGTNGVYYATNTLWMAGGNSGLAAWQMTVTNLGDVTYCVRFASTRGSDVSAWSQAVHAPTPPRVLYGFNLSCVSDIYEGPSLNDLTWFNSPLTNQYFAAMNFWPSAIFRGASNAPVKLQPLFLNPL